MYDNLFQKFEVEKVARIKAEEKFVSKNACTLNCDNLFQKFEVEIVARIKAEGKLVRKNACTLNCIKKKNKFVSFDISDNNMSDSQYKHRIGTLFSNETTAIELKMKEKHFRNMILILNDVHVADTKKLLSLRKALNDILYSILNLHK